MERPQFTIARLMLAILIIAINAGLIRAFSQGMFSGVLLFFFAMQGGLFLVLRTKGRARRFWIGFEVGGVAVLLALFWLEFFPDSALSECVSDSISLAMDSVVESPHIPVPVSSFFLYQPDVLYAALLFPPEFVLALLGGLLAMIVGPGLRRPLLSPDPRSSRCPQPSDVLPSNGCDHDRRVIRDARSRMYRRPDHVN